MIYLLSDLGATLGIIVLLVLLICVLFLRIRLAKKITISILALFLIIFIPIIGHSNWNKETRLSYELNHLNQNDVYAPSTDPNAVKEIINMKHPLRIKSVASARVPFDGGTISSNELVDINGKRFKIELACYVYPLNFTPYETWEINNITESK
ncbi:hypothetical protein [Falsibacillus albus]|uniref:Uncharacterized protein n=1 Tax=Falsibacillus albus TaxID=2478915 RepID=A0A3L7JTL1_9BACI|nr:hypothetical protein [Falsibacillus albus]RLQ93604.1 hypothetical protein D9X91_16600 [Falsibacillus albus]